MTSRWRRRVLVLAAFVLFIELVLVVAGTGPRLVLVAGIVTAVAALGWMALDLGETVQPMPWPARATSSVGALGGDARSRLLRTRLANVSAEGYTIRHLHESLVDIIDDRLLTEHLVDRFVDPDAANAIIGPELTRFVSEPPSVKALSDPRELARIVTLIENV